MRIEPDIRRRKVRKRLNTGIDSKKLSATTNWTMLTTWTKSSRVSRLTCSNTSPTFGVKFDQRQPQHKWRPMWGSIPRPRYKESHALNYGQEKKEKKGKEMSKYRGSLRRVKCRNELDHADHVHEEIKGQPLDVLQHIT